MLLRMAPLLVLLITAAGCVGKEKAPPANYALVEVTDVREEAFGYAVVLKEVDGKGKLTIVVSREQGERMLMVLAGEKPPRPWMHEVFAMLLLKMGKKVSYVSVDTLIGDVYYASIHIPGVEELDARPSDAIILALIEDAPIYVNSALLEESKVPGALAV